jgi:hypothetical protein
MHAHMLTGQQTFRAQWFHQVPEVWRYRKFHVMPTLCISVHLWISEQTGIISLCNNNWTISIIETECIYCAVQIESLNIIQGITDTKLLYQKSSTTLKSVTDTIFHKALSPSADITASYRVLHDPTYWINPELSHVALSIFHLMSKHLLLVDIWGFSVSLTARGEILFKHFVTFLNLMLLRISFRRRWFGTLSISYFRLLPIGCNVQFAADNCIMVQLSLRAAMVS